MYTGLSTRLFDPEDDCSTTDEYWSYDNQIYVSRLPTHSHSVYPSRSYFASTLNHAKTVLCSMGITDLTNVPVIHCPQSYGLSLVIDTASDLHSGMGMGMDTEGDKSRKRKRGPVGGALKLVYSGDTRPSHALARVGADASVLIHEATFDDADASEACTKRHCTTDEALCVADEMRAFRTILTHFSQRYPCGPASRPSTHRLIRPLVAFDFMSIKLGDLLWAYSLSPVFERLFSSTGDQNETLLYKESAEFSPPQVDKNRVILSSENIMCENCLTKQSDVDISPSYSVLCQNCVKL
jgi:ribonuclease Z